MMNNPQDYDDFKRFLKLQTDKVRRNVTEVMPETLGQDFLLHIDKKTPVHFVPQMPRRAAMTEDNTVPRITVSDSIVGCIIGHSGVLNDFHMEKDHGFYINMLSFDYALRPTAKLVYDADVTNEHWLLTYNKHTAKYKPVTIGKLFVSKVEYTRVPRASITKACANILIEINADIVIRFDSKSVIQKGFYKAELDETHLEHMSISRISESEYMEDKGLSATMLALVPDPAPIYSQW